MIDVLISNRCNWVGHPVNFISLHSLTGMCLHGYSTGMDLKATETRLELQLSFSSNNFLKLFLRVFLETKTWIFVMIANKLNFQMGLYEFVELILYPYFRG